MDRGNGIISRDCLLISCSAVFSRSLWIKIKLDSKIGEVLTYSIDQRSFEEFPVLSAFGYKGIR